MSITHRTAAKDLAAGVYAALSTSTFTALAPIYRVYVPPDQPAPYAVVQNITEAPGWETMGQPAKDCTFQLHVVTQARGEAQAADILDAGIAILMRGQFGNLTIPTFNVANHRVLLVEYEGSDGYDEDETGIAAYHRVGRFRVQLDQEEGAVPTSYSWVQPSW